MLERPAVPQGDIHKHTEYSNMILPEEPPDGDVNKGHIIIILTWTGFSISLLLVIARIWTRVKVVRAFGWDDGFIILALVNILSRRLERVLSL